MSMEARRIALIVLVAALLMPFAGVLFSDDSDAAGEDYAHYYYNQLSDNQKLIYEAMYDSYFATPVEPVQETVLGEQGYYLTLDVAGYTASAGSAASLKQTAFSDAATAWQATMLDLPMAWWTWSTDNAGWALPDASFDISSTSVTSLQFKIRIADSFVTNGKTVTSCVSETKTAFTALVGSDEIEGDTALELVRSINSYLCSSAFKYDDEATFQGSVYGALVAEESGVHHIACMGYSKLFKMLCDNYGIDCVCIVGAAVQKDKAPEGHMWNVVRLSIDGSLEVLGVDATFDDTGGSKEAFLLRGYSDETDGHSFVMTHQPFTGFYKTLPLWVPYTFNSPELSEDGYDFPADNDILAVITTYLPWIIMGIICAILALVLLSIARRGD